MARRKLKGKLINKSDIHEELKIISDSENAYISPNGNIYFDYGDNMMYPATTFVNKHNGYLYINYKSNNGKMVQRRVHRLVAEAYLPNPHNLPIVCHKDNNKSNPILSNLKWGTPSSNTKEAFDDGLARNDSSWSDSQSIPVCCFDKIGNFICQYGSISEAYRATGITKSGIVYQCEHKPIKRLKCNFIFRYKSDFINDIFVL